MEIFFQLLEEFRLATEGTVRRLGTKTIVFCLVLSIGDEDSVWTLFLLEIDQTTEEEKFQSSSKLVDFFCQVNKHDQTAYLQ